MRSRGGGPDTGMIIERGGGYSRGGGGYSRDGGGYSSGRGDTRMRGGGRGDMRMRGGDRGMPMIRGGDRGDEFRIQEPQRERGGGDRGGPMRGAPRGDLNAGYGAPFRGRGDGGHRDRRFND